MGKLVHQHLPSSFSDGTVEKANYFSFCMHFSMFPMPLIWGSVDQRHEEVLSWNWSVLLIRRLQKVVSIAPNYFWVDCRHLATNKSLLGVVIWSYLRLLAAPCYRPASQLAFRVSTKYVYCETNCILNDELSYRSFDNFATLVTFGRLLLNTYFLTIVFLQH